MPDWEFVAMADELPPGSWKVVDVDDVLIAVFNIEGEFYAIEDQCSHEHVCLTGLPIDRIKELENAIAKMSSLDAPIGIDGEGKVKDIIEQGSFYFNFKNRG